MKKYSFLDDYSEGCHPQILRALADTNLAQQTAYGDDDYCDAAKAAIQKHLGGAKSEIFFVAGGTLANIIILASALRPHEAVIAPQTGHIVSREAGAIEATGHKIISVPCADGKMTPEAIEHALDNNAHFPHMAKPGLVYISNAAETGRIYKKGELQALYDLCQGRGLLLFMDGARLGAALTATANDLTLKDIAALTDIFWIGGTKTGSLLGEAIVINNPVLSKDFAFHIKQRGAMLAKGRVLGLQFRELFENDLFFTAGRHANQLAQKISDAVTAQGYELADATESNLIFPILPNALVTELEKNFAFYNWSKASNDRSVLRLATSWATEEAQVEAFIAKL